MYPVSDEFKVKVQANSRMWMISITIKHSRGTLDLTDKDVIAGSLQMTEATQSGDDFGVGGVVGSDISFEILNKPEYANIQWEGAEIRPVVYLELEPGMGTTYGDLKQYTYTQIRQYTYAQLTGRYERVPLGVFYIDEYEKQRNTISLKGIDNMISLDRPYSLSGLVYPVSLYNIYLNACIRCGVKAGTASFPNMNYLVSTLPDGEYTFRDIIGYTASLAGSYAKFNRAGELEIRWYQDTGLTIGPENRFDFKPKENPIQVTGVMYTVPGEGDEPDTVYLAGTEQYVIDLGDNPLLQSSYDTVLPVIYNYVKDTAFTPYESSWQGNPAVQAGDVVTQIDRDGKSYVTLVTSSTYKYRGAGTLSAKGTPEIAMGYKGSTAKNITNTVNKRIKPVNDKLVDMEHEMAIAQEKLDKNREEIDAAMDELSQTQGDVDAAMEDVGRLESDIAAIEIGGRNLLRNSDVHVKNASYMMSKYYFGDFTPAEGETYTATVKFKLGEDRTYLSLFSSGGYRGLCSFYAEEQNSEGYASKTFAMGYYQDRYPVDGFNYLSIYQFPGEGTSESEVSMVKLEKGTKATDWTPAPEDTDAQIAVAQATADGKNTVYYATAEPTGGTYKVSDIWYDTDSGNCMYRWDGAAWAAAQFGTDAIADLAITNALIANGAIDNAKIANLDAGKITTGTLMADRIGALSITASKLAAGAVTADKIGANQITADKIVGGTITGDKLATNTITAQSGVIANAAITDAMIGNISANKISAGTITGITVRTAAGSNRVEMSDSSLKAYSAGVKRVEMDYDSIDFYTPRNEKGGAIIAGYDAEHNVPTLFLDSNAGILKLESKEDDRHHASITLDSGYRYNTEDIESAFMSAQRGDGYSYIDVMPGDIELLATRSLGSEDISKTGTIHFSPERGLELQNPPEIHFGEAAFNAPYIDCRAGVFRMNSAVIPGTSVTYSGISLMADNKINIYFSGQLKHQFRADGTKTGGSIEIDGKTLGMSPIDSPRVLFLDVIPDIEAKPEGTEVRFDAQFAKAMNGYKVFPNRPVDIRDKTPEGFTVVGEGKVDLMIIGNRIGYEGTYWQDMSGVEEQEVE